MNYEYAYINGIKRLQNGYRIYKFPLFEKYGIVQYNDSRYDKLIQDCVKKIEVFKQSNNCKYDYEVPNGNNGYTKCFKVSIKPYNSIIWLKELNIYYGICDYDYFDCFLLDSVDITENDVLTKSDNFIYHNNMTITPFIEKDGIVEIASIVLLCSEHYKMDIFSAIRHELKHLYDSHINHIKIQNLSADIIFSELYMKRNKLRFDTDYFMYSDNNLKHFRKI